MLKPRYYDQGVDAYWLDETDGEVCGAHASTFELWNFSKVSCLSQACLGKMATILMKFAFDDDCLKNEHTGDWWRG